MKDLNHLSLNGHSLQVFLIVLEEGSVSKAAERLGITQSAVSHSLEKLRAIFNDPLFIRSGRGIEATERAYQLREPIQTTLDHLKQLMDYSVFDPKTSNLTFKIAANDFQRNLIFPSLLQHLKKENIDTRFRFIASGIPDAEILRQSKCDFIITPFPPEGSDVYQLKLFDDHLVCFYDANMREPPKTWEEFRECDFVEARFTNKHSSLEALSNYDVSKLKSPIISVPNFGALENFIQNSEMITVALSLMKNSELKNLNTAPLPFEARDISMYLAWHKRDHNNPTHQWFRSKIQLIVKDIITSD